MSFIAEVMEADAAASAFNSRRALLFAGCCCSSATRGRQSQVQQNG